MTTNMKHRFDADNTTPSIKNFTNGVASNTSLRRTLQVIQPVATSDQLVGRINESHKQSPKRKYWNDDQPKSCKKSRTQNPQDFAGCNNENSGTDMTKKAYQLLVKSNPPSLYWKELAEERRKALFQVLQENERKLTGQSADELMQESEQEVEETHGSEELKLESQQEAESKLTTEPVKESDDKCSLRESEEED
ncbi:geminin isoform X2 [Hemitrygon akajei]|uniref:geminin isoform X2 n=1 Tax=Hemitrygon akajei TaxID=2704970 RepID=UPI003BF9C82C